MARPNFSETKIESGAEWETLHPITDPIDPSRIKMELNAAKNGEIGRLHRIYERMETDDRYGGAVSKLKRGIASQRVRVSPSKHFRNASEKRTAQEYADKARFLMQNLNMRQVLKVFANPYLKTFDVFENHYERGDAPFYEGRAYFLNKIESVPTTRLMVGQGVEAPYGKPAILELDGTVKPVAAYDERKVYTVTDDQIDDFSFVEQGVARRCLTWWVIKQYIVRWWGEFADTYGEPVRIAQVSDMDLSDDRRSKIERALASLGKNGWAIMPQDIALDLKDMSLGSNASGHNVYQSVLAAANTAFTVAVLGQTDTTEGGEGAYAKAKIHDNVRHDIMEDVAGMAEDGLEHSARSLLSINEGTSFEPHLAPTFQIPLPTPMDLAKKARAYNTLQKKMSMPIPARQVRDEFGIDSPTAGEPVIADGQRFESEAEYLEYMEEKQERMQEAREQGTAGRQQQIADGQEGEGGRPPEEDSDTADNA